MSERIAARQKEIETQNADALKKQAESLRAVLKTEHETTLNVIRAQQQSLRKSLRPVFWTTLLCLTVVLAALALLWGGTWWKARQLSNLLDQVKIQKAALAEIEKTTGGLGLVRVPEGVFVVLPSTATSKFWDCNSGQTCVKIGD